MKITRTFHRTRNMLIGSVCLVVGFSTIPISVEAESSEDVSVTYIFDGQKLVPISHFMGGEYEDSEYDNEHMKNRRSRWYKYYRKSRTRTETVSASAVTTTVVAKRFVPNDPYYKYQWGLKTVNAEDAWQVSMGKDVLVAVLDTGVDYNHSDMTSQVWTNPGEIAGDGIDNDGNGYIDDHMGWDFAGKNWYEFRMDNDVIDKNGHGTHVAGIIAAAGDNEEGIIGLAPEAKILPVKVLDDRGRGTWNSVAKGIKYAVDMGAKVINLSLGGWGYASPFSYLGRAVKYAQEKGAIIVAAAGNSNYNADLFLPANMDDVIAVAATANKNDGRAGFSNYGNVIDVAAPGINILSLRASGTGNSIGYDFYPKYDTEAEYRWLHGTSMATPFVSALAALLVADDPNLSVSEIRKKIRYSAEDAGSYGFDKYFGYGRIDAYRALTYDKEGYEDEEYSGRAYYETLPPGSLDAAEASSTKQEEPHKIKGVNVEEITSKNEAIQENRTDFTGASPKEPFQELIQV